MARKRPKTYENITNQWNKTKALKMENKRDL